MKVFPPCIIISPGTGEINDKPAKGLDLAGPCEGGLRGAEFGREGGLGGS